MSKLESYVSLARGVLESLTGPHVAPSMSNDVGRRSDSADSTGALELLAEISKHIPKGRAVLEVGCGNGHISKAIIEKGNRLLAVDLSEDAILECRRTFGDAARFEAVDIMSYETEQRFDYVFINQVLEQVPDDEAMLRALYALLAPGGRIVVSENVADSRVPEFNVHTYSVEDLRGKMERAGFSLETESTFGGALSQFAAIASKKIRFPKPFLRAVREFPLYRALMVVDAKLRLGGGRTILVGIKPWH